MHNIMARTIVRHVVSFTFIKEDRPMLVLSRRIGEKLVIGDQITISVNRISGNRVSLGIDAPPHVRIVRSELHEALLDVLHADDHADGDASSGNGTSDTAVVAMASG
jgi:carbon storage regulator CsrA